MRSKYPKLRNTASYGVKASDGLSRTASLMLWGNAPYQDFREPFVAMLERWDPAPWADLFAKAGAQYVVHVTKHHDGFCLWPSDVPNPHEKDWAAPRDVAGDLAAAVRARGMRFGVYYSGGLDWTFEPRAMRGIADASDLLLFDLPA